MNKLLIASLAALTAAIPAAASAQNAFQGFYAQVATGYQTTKFGSYSGPVTLASGTQIATLNTQSFNVSTAPAILGLGYTFTLDPKWVLGLGFDYDLVSKKSEFGVTLTRPGYPPAAGSPEMKVNQRWSLFAAPGYLVSSTGLVYGKVGYASAKASADGDVYDTAATLNGYQLGIGYRGVLSGNFYGFIESNYMKYGNPTYNVTIYGSPAGAGYAAPSVSVNAYNVLVGVGLRF